MLYCTVLYCTITQDWHDRTWTPLLDIYRCREEHLAIYPLTIIIIPLRSSTMNSPLYVVLSSLLYVSYRCRSSSIILNGANQVPKDVLSSFRPFPFTIVSSTVKISPWLRVLFPYSRIIISSFNPSQSFSQSYIPLQKQSLVGLKWTIVFWWRMTWLLFMVVVMDEFSSNFLGV